MFGSIYNRIYDKVLYKFSLIFTAIYYIIFNGNAFENKIYFYLLLAFATSVGIAGIGYMFNDYIDFDDDVKNNKKNIFINKSKFQIIILAFIFLTFAINPWFFFPFTKITLSLISIEILLLFTYAFPPFRLKERPILGIVCDSLYAQVIPCMLACYTFYKIGTAFNYKIEIIIFYICWLFLLGIRNILLHQIEDIKNDLNTKTRTFVTEYGILFAKRIIKYIIFFEIIYFILILYNLTEIRNILLLTYILYIFLLYSLNRNSFQFYNINQRILNEFYEIHFPFLLLLLYTIQQPKFIYIFIFNIILLLPIYRRFAKGFLQKYF
jgi:4-hydroxybenzoate polyprenyltransferase